MQNINQPTMTGQAFWQQRYDEGSTRWEQGVPSHNVRAFYQEYLSPLPKGKLLVPGCGYGHEAAYFAEQGFDVLAVDIVPDAITECEKRYGHIANLQFKCIDFFELSQIMAGNFDWVVEYTFFVAILPSQRAQYVDTILQLLKPNGIYVAGFFTRPAEITAEQIQASGPPFRVLLPEVIHCFSANFQTAPNLVSQQLSITLPAAWPQLVCANSQREELMTVFTPLVAA